MHALSALADDLFAPSVLQLASDAEGASVTGRTSSLLGQHCRH